MLVHSAVVDYNKSVAFSLSFIYLYCH